MAGDRPPDLCVPPATAGVTPVPRSGHSGNHHLAHSRRPSTPAGRRLREHSQHGAVPFRASLLGSLTNQSSLCLLAPSRRGSSLGWPSVPRRLDALVKVSQECHQVAQPRPRSGGKKGEGSPLGPGGSSHKRENGRVRFPEKSGDPAVFVTPNRPPDPAPPRAGGPECPEAPLLVTFEPVEDRSSPAGGGLSRTNLISFCFPPRK